MKKIAALLLIMLLSTAMLTGCSKEGQTERETYLSLDKAREILQTWLDNYPFQSPGWIESDGDLSLINKKQGEQYNREGENYYLFYVAMEELGSLETLVHKETGELFHLASPGNNRFDLLDNWYSSNHTEDAKDWLTNLEAWDLVQQWLDEHPDMSTPYESTTIAGMGDEMYPYNGQEYYLFELNGYYWLDILVNPEGGDLLCIVREDSDEPIEPIIEPLMDYYHRFY